MPVFTAVCQRCGKTFTTKRNAFPPKFCSMACYRPPVYKTCPTCGKTFRATACKLQERIYCSMGCYTAARTGVAHGRVTEHLVFTCEMCGKQFEVYPSTIKHDPPRFCGDECFYKWLKGSERSERVTVTCQSCGREFRVRKYKLDHGGGLFCSRRCVSCNKGPTSIERLLMAELDVRGIAYESQHPIARYLIDIAFPNRMLAVEADGVYWHSLPNMVKKDARKDRDLAKRGWTVLHFGEAQIHESPSACVDTILEHLHS